MRGYQTVVVALALVFVVGLVAVLAGCGSKEVTEQFTPEEQELRTQQLKMQQEMMDQQRRAMEQQMGSQRPAVGGEEAPEAAQ